MTSVAKSLWESAVRALLCGVVLSSCGEAPVAQSPVVTISGSTMGTYYRVTVPSPLNGISEEGLAGIVELRLDEIDTRMSTYIPDSEVSRFNRSTGGDWFPVSEDTAVVVAEALRIFQQSEEAFDITVGPLVNLWGFGPTESDRHIPDAAEIRETLKRVGSKHLQVRLSPPALKKDIDELQIDLSAIAKGFAVDAVAEALKEKGLANFLVDIGGEMLASGEKAKERPWQIAIERPVAKEKGIQGVMPLSNISIATSGDYRNYFESDGQRFSHEIDPRTGESIRHQLVSVSILNDSCMTADAWATALIVLGPEKGQALAEKANLTYFFIIKEKNGFREKKSAGFAPLTSLP